MTTVAKPNSATSSHWYYQDGRPAYEIAKKDGSGMRAATLADARKLNLLPSVTTILKVLHKEALVQWLIEQAVLATMTTPRLEAETDDEFVFRVLHTERVQDQEAAAARDRGTEIHQGMEDLFACKSVSPELLPWIKPAFMDIGERGRAQAVEKIVIGEGYAGKADLFQDQVDVMWIWDWKTTKNLPDPKKGAWSDHRLQLSAYAKAVNDCINIRTGNVYISTVDCGKYVVCEHEPWEDTFQNGFLPLLTHWQWSTGYRPKLDK